MIRTAIEQAVQGDELSPETVTATMGQVLRGEASDVQMAAWLAAMRTKGETPAEIAAAARALRDHCEVVSLSCKGPLLDTCGTGGDAAQTFNVSTAAAVVAAACGVPVAKHGNRAVSSRAGSADVLEALGIRIDLPQAIAKQCLDELGIVFLFAPTYHQAMRHAAPVRRALRIRTLFNLLGPLANPAGATHQLVGVYAPERVRPVAKVLGNLGAERAWVVHGSGGLDEVSPLGATQVAAWDGHRVREFTLSPADFGYDPVAEEALRGGDAERNAAIMRSVLSGAPGPKRQTVVMNAAAALCVAGIADEPRKAARLAEEAIDSGRTERLVERWADWTKAHAERS